MGAHFVGVVFGSELIEELLNILSRASPHRISVVKGTLKNNRQYRRWIKLIKEVPTGSARYNYY